MLANVDIAKCVGLWLAEGGNKTEAEITFTNNCFDLINFFHLTLNNNGLLSGLNPRIYAYSRNEKPIVPLSVIIKYYHDKRANHPYFIYRVASRKLNKLWRGIVEQYKQMEEMYSYLLSGFFAGEGNIKFLMKNHMHRSIRIAQGKRNSFLERMLDSLGFTYSFSLIERSYSISGRANLTKAKELGICDLHPLKKRLFHKLIKSYKDEIIYYPKGWLKEQVFALLIFPRTTKELSEIFNRSFARIQDVLIELKKEGKLKNYRKGKKSYWIKVKEGEDKNVNFRHR